MPWIVVLSQVSKRICPYFHLFVGNRITLPEFLNDFAENLPRVMGMPSSPRSNSTPSPVVTEIPASIVWGWKSYQVPMFAASRLKPNNANDFHLPHQALWFFYLFLSLPKTITLYELCSTLRAEARRYCFTLVFQVVLPISTNSHITVRNVLTYFSVVRKTAFEWLTKNEVLKIAINKVCEC